VPGEADAAAHRDAVGERDDRLGVLGDAGVEGVLGAEELCRVVGSSADDLVVEAAHVAARAQAALARAVEHHDLDVGVALPLVERRSKRLDHVEVERIDRLGAVEREVPDAVVAHGAHALSRLRG
jgi:hypothetical protein